MDSKCHAVRMALLDLESPRIIADKIRSFNLPIEEEAVIIAREAKGRSIIQIADDFGMSPETVKRRRKRGFERMAKVLGI